MTRISVKNEVTDATGLAKSKVLRIVTFLKSNFHKKRRYCMTGKVDSA